MRNDTTMPMRLLLVDDELLERKAIQIIIQKNVSKQFIVVGEASNGKEAVQRAKELKPDIILMDIKMPGMDGLEAVKIITCSAPETFIIFLTAYDDFDYVKKAMRIGAIGYLLKPLRTKDLLDELERVYTAYIEKQKKNNEQQTIQQQLKEAIPWLQRNLCLGLILGLWEEQEAVKLQGDLIQLETLPQVAFAVYIKNIEDSANVKGKLELMRYQLQKNITELIDKNPFGLCAPLSDSLLVGLWGSLESDRGSRLLKLLQQILSSTSNITSIQITIGVGSFCYSIDQLPLSAWEAQTAAHLGMFYLGADRIVSIEDIQSIACSTSDTEHFIERKLLSALQDGNESKISAAFRNLLSYSSGYHGVELQTFKGRLTNIMNKFFSSLSLPSENNLGKASPHFDFYQRIAFAHSVEELEKWVLSLTSVRSNIDVIRQQGVASQEVEKVIDFLQQNYKQDISLKDLAKLIYLSPDYFSRIFKEQVGCSFSEYLSRLRLESAKKMLAETELPINTVATESGYSDANYFSRVFSRSVGVSPKIYRKMSADR